MTLPNAVKISYFIVVVTVFLLALLLISLTTFRDMVMALYLNKEQKHMMMNDLTLALYYVLSVQEYCSDRSIPLCLR